MNLADLMQLPWTVVVERRNDDGEYFVARVTELPGLIAVGENEAELEAALEDALSSHLKSYIQDGETPPLPVSSSSTYSVSFSGGTTDAQDETASEVGTATQEVPVWA